MTQVESRDRTGGHEFDNRAGIEPTGCRLDGSQNSAAVRTSRAGKVSLRPQARRFRPCRVETLASRRFQPLAAIVSRAGDLAAIVGSTGSGFFHPGTIAQTTVGVFQRITAFLIAGISIRVGFPDSLGHRVRIGMDRTWPEKLRGWSIGEARSIPEAKLGAVDRAVHQTCHGLGDRSRGMGSQTWRGGQEAWLSESILVFEVPLAPST